jgi:signal transduction histidine kinase
VKHRSLRGRLGLIGGIAILAALAVSLAGLSILFDRHVQRVAVADLEARSFTVAAMIEPEPGGGASWRPAPMDPLYDQPFSGHYWQLEVGEDTRRSRSLWDHVLPRDGAAMPAGTTRVLDMPGPQGESLLTVESWLQIGGGTTARPVRILVATDRKALDAARTEFLSDLLPYSILLAFLLGVAFWTQVTIGLLPLRAVSARVVALRNGRLPRIGSDLPVEVLPLAKEIDALLDVREKEVTRARNRAGDLAHGLKTPLQALMGDAEQVRRIGEADLADSIESIAGAMRRLVDRELSRARTLSGHGAQATEPMPVAQSVVNVLRRTPEGARLDWQVDVPSGMAVRIDPDDLTEILGALAENAARHARSTVAITAAPDTSGVVITVRDDGAGVPEDAVASVIQRGIRADERAGGSGIGLAIAVDILEATGGDMTLRNLDPGFEVSLRLQRA